MNSSSSNSRETERWGVWGTPRPNNERGVARWMVGDGNRASFSSSRGAGGRSRAVGAELGACRVTTSNVRSLESGANLTKAQSEALAACVVHGCIDIGRGFGRNDKRYECAAGTWMRLVRLGLITPDSRGLPWKAGVIAVWAGRRAWPTEAGKTLGKVAQPEACPQCDSGDVTAAYRLPPGTWKCQTCGAVWRTK